MKILLSLPILFLLSACRPDPVPEGHDYILRASPLTITLSFDLGGNRYAGQAVNKYFGTYTRDCNHIQFSTPQSGMLSGSEEDMQTEDSYLTDLARSVTYTLTEEMLDLTLSDGRHLIFLRQN